MAQKLDLKSLSTTEWVMGIAFVVIGMIIAYTLVGALVADIPQPLLAAIGAAIGVAGWFSYLLKRNT